jgi:hypothetical protein
MIYSEAFDALPQQAKSLVYERLWTVLSGAARDWDYSNLPPDTRRAIIEILRETKKDLPASFTAPTRAVLG